MAGNIVQCEGSGFNLQYSWRENVRSHNVNKVVREGQPEQMAFKEQQICRYLGNVPIKRTANKDSEVGSPRLMCQRKLM